MKNSIVLFLFLFLSGLFAQEKDFRGEFRFIGSVNSFAISPTQEVWAITSRNHLYTSSGIQKEWEHKKEFENLGRFQIFSFFDSKQAILTGDISSEKGSSLYRTTDVGSNWELVSFGEPEELIYDVFTTPQGEAWLVSDKGNIYFSKDFAKTWSKKESPFSTQTRLTSIVIEKAPNEITSIFLGSVENGLRRSKDNGKTWKALPTPREQNKLGHIDSQKYPHNLVNKIALFHNFIILNQYGAVFYSERSKIEWKEFKETVPHFEKDSVSNRLFGLNENFQVIEIDPKLNISLFNPRAFPTKLISMKCVQGHVFLATQGAGFCKITPTEFIFSYPLTSKQPILFPDQIKKYGDLFWGVTPYHIYQTNDLKKGWHRVGSSYAAIGEFLCRNENEIIFWDGRGNNFIFNKLDQSVKEIDTLKEYDVIRVLPKKDYWIAYGGMQYETTFRVDVARTYFSGQFEGTRREGFVSLSKDRGATWEIIDTWKTAGVANLFCDSNGNLYLYSYIGSLRKLTRKEDSYQIEDILIATKNNKEKIPYVERSKQFYFLNDKIGFVTGWTHHRGNFCFKTEDGGNTWKNTAAEKIPYENVISYQGGYLAKVDEKIYFLEGNSKQLLLNPLDILPGEKNIRIREISFDKDENLFLYCIGRQEHYLFYEASTKKTILLASLLK